jgi:hypothetical protein
MALWVTNIEDDFRVINMDAIICVKKSKTNKNCWDVFLEGNVNVELTHKEMFSLYDNLTEEMEYYEYDPDYYEEEENNDDVDTSKPNGYESLFDNKEKTIKW